ncbi:MAG TPA: hypothetical protein VK152_13110 [Paludibacter sp.]|nr:hypothetical protein [Paludibacter sp.]
MEKKTFGAARVAANFNTKSLTGFMKEFINKKMMLSAAAAVVLVVALSGLQGCGNEDIASVATVDNSKIEFKVLDKVYEAPRGASIWKAQLNKIIENDSLLTKDELELLNFDYVGKINNIQELEKIKLDIANYTTILPVYENNGFTMNDYSGKKEYIKELLDVIIPLTNEDRANIHKKYSNSLTANVIYDFEQNDLGVVNIEWKYKGANIITKCLVSEKKGIVYDNFLYFICASSPLTTYSQKLPIRKVRFKSNSEIPIPVSWTMSPMTAEAHNYFGMRVWYYEINCKVTGTQIGASKSIDDYSMSAVHDALIGFSCVADIRSKSFVEGNSGHLDYAYAYSHGTAVSLSLSWNGTGFTISGGGEGSTGEDHVGTDDLRE